MKQILKSRLFEKELKKIDEQYNRGKKRKSSRESFRSRNSCELLVNRVERKIMQKKPVLRVDVLLTSGKACTRFIIQFTVHTLLCNKNSIMKEFLISAKALR